MIVSVILDRELSFLTISHSTIENPRMTAKTMAQEMGSRCEVNA